MASRLSLLTALQSLHIPYTYNVLKQQDYIRQNYILYEGRDSVVENRNLLFTRLEDQTDDDFLNYVNLAVIELVYKAIVNAYVGTIFSKPPETDLELDEYTNVDFVGNDLSQYSSLVVAEILKNGFAASMIDWNDEQKKPYMRYIRADDIVGISTKENKGIITLERFIFKVCVEEISQEDEFEYEYITRYTVLDLLDGKYRVRQYEETDSVSFDQVPDSETFPKQNGKFLDYIPVVIHGSEANNFDIKKSILQDISDLNITLLSKRLDQAHMMFYTSLPTPWTTGVSPDDQDRDQDTIGPTRIWRISEPDAAVGILEFSGASYDAHEKFIQEVKDIMATIGAQLLKKEGVSRETATSVLLRTGLQTSVISNTVENISNQMESVVAMYEAWNGNEDFTGQYRLNTDLIRVDIDPNAVIALVKSWLDGAISHETVFDKLKEGELIPPDRTFSQELEKIQENQPPFFSKDKDAEIGAEAAKTATDEEAKLNSGGTPLDNTILDNPVASSDVK
ncbi:MAG: DUF4055 domain-containing protein [Candidatus Scalindua sp.]|jgi:hypothetical protein|nr:DUF4055 domain-containing protein [Candidatus Scalindua sp.]